MGIMAALFDTNFLLASLLWGSVGAGYCLYGKKRGETIPLGGGLALIGLSYFVPWPSLCPSSALP